MVKGMNRMRDIYDTLPPERGAQLRRLNTERLAELEARGQERRARLARAAAVHRDQRSEED
jgi:hypothetical protein